MRKGADIAERLIVFGLAVLELGERIPKQPGPRHVAMQLIRSATSAGANYEEARGAESGADFVHKLGIAAKEAREACYWLTLVQRSRWLRLDVGHLVSEANQLAALLGASIRTARRNLSG